MSIVFVLSTSTEAKPASPWPSGSGMEPRALKIQEKHSTAEFQTQPVCQDVKTLMVNI